MTRFFLCSEQDIPDQQAREFKVETEQGQLDLFLIRQDDQVHAYKNQCPHLEIPLNWQPDQFMSVDGINIQCSTHGALFTIDKGNCIIGPCAGENLRVLTLEQRDDDEVWLQL